MWTRGHVRPDDATQTPYAAKIRWGSAPGLEVPDEADALTKIQAINEFVLKYGPLVESIPIGKMLDVQTGRPILTSNLRTAQQLALSESLAQINAELRRKRWTSQPRCVTSDPGGFCRFFDLARNFTVDGGSSGRSSRSSECSPAFELLLEFSLL